MALTKKSKKSKKSKSGSKRLMSKRSKSGSKNPYRSCRRNVLPDKWFAELESQPGVKRKKGEVQAAYRDILGLGAKGCHEFRNEAVPCRYMPKKRVGYWAARCKLKGRAKQSKKTLCKRLMAKTDAKPFRKSCIPKRLGDLYVARMQAGYTDPKLYNTRGMRKVLKHYEIPFSRKDTNSALRATIAANADIIRTVRKQAKEQKAEIHAEAKAQVAAIQASPIAPEEKKHAIQEVKQEEKAAVAQVDAQAKADEQELKDAIARDERARKMAEQSRARYEAGRVSAMGAAIAQEAKAAQFKPSAPPLPQYGPPELPTLKKVSQATLKYLIQAAHLPPQDWPQSVATQTVQTKDGPIIIYDTKEMTRQVGAIFNKYRGWDEVLNVIERKINNTKDVRVKDVLAALLQSSQMGKTTNTDKQYLQVLAQLLFAFQYDRQCKPKMKKSNIEELFSVHKFAALKTGVMLTDTFPSYISGHETCTWD